MSGQRVRSPEIERFRGDLFPSDSINFLRNLLNDSNRFLTNGARMAVSAIQWPLFHRLPFTHCNR